MQDIYATCAPADMGCYPLDFSLRPILYNYTKKLLELYILCKAGLLRRMPCEPEELARQMNHLCIEMTHARRKEDAFRARKRVLRKMKPLAKTDRRHTRRHRDRPERDYSQAEYSLAQALRIIEGMGRMLDQIPP